MSSTTASIEGSAATTCEQLLGRVDGGDDLDSTGAQDLADPLAQQHRVVGDGDSQCARSVP